jgi:hypothetical protein
MSKDFADLPGLVQVTANTHAAMLEAALPGKLAAYWVVGSAALGDFVPGRSDVDFVAATKCPLASEDVEALRRVHRALRGRRMLAGLDGWYVPAAGLAGDSGALATCARFNEGKFCGGRPFAPNSPDGWVLRQYGVRVQGEGPEPAYAVDWDAMLRGMAENIDTYWRKWVRDSRGLSARGAALLLSPRATEWGVLGVARLYYTFRERDVTSKTSAGEYALEHLPERWRGIVLRALETRRRGGPRRAPSMRRRRETLDFMEFMLGECARLYPVG